MGVTCNDCRFAHMADYGYSNYTTEGTTFNCIKGLHPQDGFDRWYGEDKRLDFAEECPGFVAGEPLCTDVDMEEGDLSAYTSYPDVLMELPRYSGPSY